MFRARRILRVPSLAQAYMGRTRSRMGHDFEGRPGFSNGKVSQGCCCPGQPQDFLRERWNRRHSKPGKYRRVCCSSGAADEWLGRGVGVGRWRNFRGWRRSGAGDATTATDSLSDIDHVYDTPERWRLCGEDFRHLYACHRRTGLDIVKEL